MDSVDYFKVESTKLRLFSITYSGAENRIVFGDLYSPDSFDTPSRASGRALMSNPAQMQQLVLLPCRAVPCRAVPCRAVPCRAVPCHVMSYAIPCHMLVA